MRMSGLFHHILKNRQHAHFIDALAGVNSGISAIALYPQLFDLLRHQSAEDLSPVTFFLIAVNSLIWFIYGIHRQAPPLIISSCFNAIASIAILSIIWIT